MNEKSDTDKLLDLQGLYSRVKQRQIRLIAERAKIQKQIDELSDELSTLQDNLVELYNKN